MDPTERLDLLKVSKNSRKLEKLLECKDEFESLISAEVGKLGAKKVFESPKKEDSLESEMVVCVRVRPRLDHEISANYMLSTFSSNPEVLVVEPGFRRSVHIGDGGTIPGDKPRITASKFLVDLAFGEEDDNDVVYEAVAQPLLDLTFQGGTSTILAYGQTGSGKTFTISGILDKLGQDLVNRIQENNFLKLHLSYIQLLGNAASDLLDGNTKVDILEDKFGKVNIVGAKEEEVKNRDDIIRIIQTAADQRTTSTTMKNDTSSRSHAICKIRVQNTAFKEVDDGIMYIIDLAGSENAADSQFHDKSRIKETKEINKSLMCLKECIRNRAKSAKDPHSLVHIPYRQSKLSLLLKDAFELESHKLCQTVVFANVSPTLADNAMTLNTLRYVAPIKEGMKNRSKVVPDPRNPASWSNEKLSEWVEQESNGKISSEVLCPWESGKQLLSLPESEILKRIMKGNPKIDEKKAKDFYLRLWKLLVDARMKERKEKMRKKRVLKDINHPKANTKEEEEMIKQNNQLPEIELVIETATEISDQDFVEKIIKLEEVEEVKLFTVKFSPEENKQRFYIKIIPAIMEQLNTTNEERKKIFHKTGKKVLYCDFRDVRSDDEKFTAEAKKQPFEAVIP